MQSSMLRKTRTLAFLVSILLSAIASASFLPRAEAAVTISYISPNSGYVGTSVSVVANSSTVNGSYTIYFDGNPISSGNATAFLIIATFQVPHTTQGPHNVTVRDEEGEGNIQFTVLSRYSIELSVPEAPGQLRENETLSMLLNVTGGEARDTYPANITIGTPANTTHSIIVSLPNTTDVGHHYASTTYPNMDWTPSGASTNFTGTYTVSWTNNTEVLANKAFLVGLTNSTEYHRNDFVDIEAVDYPPDQNVSVTLSGTSVSYSDSFNATADGYGVVNTNFTIPSNMQVGSYSLKITPVPDSKLQANDTQAFQIPGFETDLFTRNLANETVPSIFVRIHDDRANISYNKTSNVNGTTSLNLEKGEYTFEAFSRNVKVGELTNYTVTTEEPVNVTCQLTNLNIILVDALDTSLRIPFVAITLFYNYTTNLDVSESKNTTETGSTNLTGVLQFRSLFLNVAYSINASIYQEVFNQGNSTINGLPATPYVDVAILCPVRALQINIFDKRNQPIVGASVVAQESMGARRYSGNSGSEGKATLSCTFGRYAVKVYYQAALLNETTIDLFQDQNISMICMLYGLNVSIKIMDYFGQPISNCNITWQSENMQNSDLTKSDGKVAFENIVGGYVIVTVTLPGQSQPCIAAEYYVSDSTNIDIRIDRYTMLAGLLVETNQLATGAIIMIVVAIIISMEFLRRRKLKPEKDKA